MYVLVDVPRVVPPPPKSYWRAPAQRHGFKEEWEEEMVPKGRTVGNTRRQSETVLLTSVSARGLHTARQQKWGVWVPRPRTPQNGAVPHGHRAQPVSSALSLVWPVLLVPVRLPDKAVCSWTMAGLPDAQ